MDDENLVEGETLEAQEGEETPEESPAEEFDIEDLKKKASAYEAQKIRAEKAEKSLKKYMQAPEKESSVDSVDLIKLGKKLQDYSDDELDFVVGYAKSKKPEDILKALENPYIQAGVKSQREKVEKEKLSLKPTGTQEEKDKPKSLAQQINTASMEEKEELLTKYGFYRNPTPPNRFKRNL